MKDATFGKFLASFTVFFPKKEKKMWIDALVHVDVIFGSVDVLVSPVKS